MRVWDALLHEGPKVLYRMALALLKMNEEVLLQQDNPGFVLHELKRAAHATHNRAALMKVSPVLLSQISNQAMVSLKEEHTCLIHSTSN